MFLQEATHNIRAKDEGPERAQEAANVRTGQGLDSSEKDNRLQFYEQRFKC